MTICDTQKQEETLRPLDRLETELIETDMAEILGTSGDYVRVYEDDTVNRDAADVAGWTIYGSVYVDRHMLPVCGHLPSGQDDPDHAAHRRQILDAIAGSHAAGRVVLHEVVTTPVEPGTIGFDSVVPPDVVTAIKEGLRSLAAGRAA